MGSDLSLAIGGRVRESVYIYIYIYTRVGLSLLSDIVSGPYHLAIGPKVDGQHVLPMYFFFYIVNGWSVVKLMCLSEWS